jgi:hypothetical protein
MSASAWKFLYRNWALASQGAVWSASSAVPTLPVSHLGLPQRQRVWRSTGTTAQSLPVDLGQSRPVGGLALVDGNLTPAATVLLEGNAIDVWPGAVSHVVVPWDPGASGVIPVWFTATETYRWWRLSLSDPSNPSGFLQLGQVYLGPALEMRDVEEQSRGPGLGASRRRVDPSLVGRSPSGTPYAFAFPRREQWSLPTGLLTKDQVFDTLLTTLEESGLTEDVVMSLYAADPAGDAPARQTNLYGRFTDLPELSGAESPYYRGTLAFQESR